MLPLSRVYEFLLISRATQGPFWLWKVDDDYPAHLMEYGT